MQQRHKKVLNTFCLLKSYQILYSLSFLLCKIIAFLGDKNVDFVFNVCDIKQRSEHKHGFVSRV